MGEKKVEVVKKEEVITAVYKLHLHCPECAREVEKQFTKISGVQKVDVDFASGKVNVKGVFDVKKVHERIEKKTRKKVELISPKPAEKKEEKIVEKKEVKKEEVIKTTTLKVYMHCPNCENDLKSKMLEHKAIHKFETNREAQTCTVVGTIEEKELIEYLRKRTRKNGEIVPPKIEKKVEEKEETKKIKVEEKVKEIVVPCPYYVYYPHASPYSFSDEDPNACCVM